ncbi:MAG: hypothetical protein ACR2PL_01920, partial [Dehalococcoidia bacterium]
SDALYSVDAPPGQLIIVGDPSGTQPATVTGADAVYVYDSASGAYQQPSTLQPGEGAWAYSAAGGIVRIAPMSP